ncbi:MBL fold metallo-hydrolase [Paenibacillus sp.]|uniref:MBL fold metallo-hydrolase n=1 Tax=Paenibacillus sp. TaxID=58172 RepID=UPI002D4FC7E3|nr:MBL fold metallo-hydrolase [Paenibacillus sp.]HZG55648.1 MBL fold metallo-hydrolase [Paenibacillus sp.]
MIIQLIRSASLRMEYAGKQFWVDPMFAEAGTLPPIPNSPNPRPNPLVGLPFDIDRLPVPDAVLLTHNHPDHFDPSAADRLPKEIPFFCQPEDAAAIQSHRFAHVRAIDSSLEWEGIRIYRTGGKHGTGAIGEMMGPVSGFVLEAEGEPTLYLTGDTIWCDEVEEAIRRYRPSVIVCFAGDARFLEGGPIIMDKEDVAALAAAAPGSRILVAHMESWNHCLLSRDELAQYLRDEDLLARVDIPRDGDTLSYSQVPTSS